MSYGIYDASVPVFVKTLKNMRVTGSGTLQGDTLKVGSLTKSDKPFGGS